MKKCITRSISLVLTLLMMITIAPLTFITKNANAAPSNQTKNITASSQTVYWGGFNRTNMPSLSKDDASMITSWSFNGNDTFTINISENTSYNSRTGHIYAKQNNKTIATFTIVQAGKTHTHTYGNWITTIEPTCTKKGSKYRVCKYCPQRDYRYIPMIAHNYQPINNKKGQINIKCSRCSKTINDVSYSEYLSYSKKDDTTTAKLGYLRAVFKYETNVTDNDMLELIYYMDNYKKSYYGKTKLELLCESFEEAKGDLSDYNSALKFFGIDKLEKLDNACKYVNTGKGCIDILNGKSGCNVNTWKSYLNTLQDIMSYAGNADLFYSNIIGQLIPYLEKTATAIKRTQAKKYLASIYAKIEEMNISKYDKLSPMSVIKDMDFWMNYCISINSNKKKMTQAALDMFETFYDSTVAYQKYQPTAKKRTVAGYINFINKEDQYLDTYYGK